MAESVLRAYRLMTAEPTGPVYVCLDAALQVLDLGALGVVADLGCAEFAVQALQVVVQLVFTGHIL